MTARSMWRRLLLGILTLALGVSVVACGGGGKSDSDKNSTLGSNGDDGQGSSNSSVDAPPTTTGIGSGKMVADLGFRPEKDGFPFENYGDGPFTNLTPVELRRIFGDGVCADIENGTCILTPPAAEWMTVMNQTMGGGHCYGFSVASLRIFQKQIKLDPFGSNSNASLKIEGNKALQQEIAYSFVYQMFDPVRENLLGGTPNEVLDKLIDNLKKGASASETYTIGFFKPEGGGGHAVTPFAVEDRGNGEFAVLIYDNNFPKATREMLFDRNKNSWSYIASTNPNEPASKYVGDANTKSLGLYPTNPGTKTQPCPFCAGPGSAAIRGGSLYAEVATQTYNEIYLEGDPANHGHLLITDAQGKRTGYVGNKLVNEIPGAQVRNEMFTDDWRYSEEPTYRIPTGVKFTITIDGSPLKKTDPTDVIMIGPGYDIGVVDIQLEPNQKDTLTLSSDGKSLAYKTSAKESPIVVVGIDGKDADYSFAIKGLDVDGGGTINVNLDTAAGSLSISSAGSKTAGTYGAAISRITDKGEQVFGHDNIALQPDDVATLMYGKWPGNKQGMPLSTKRKSGQTETLTLTDDD